MRELPTSFFRNGQQSFSRGRQKNWRWQAMKLADYVDEGGSAHRPKKMDEGEGGGVHAFRRGIVLKCVDGELCRIFPIIIMYSADYPELVPKITAPKDMRVGEGGGEGTGGSDKGEGTGAGDESEGEGTGEDDECESEGVEGDNLGEDENKGIGGNDQGVSVGVGEDVNEAKAGEGEGAKSEKTGGKQSESGWGCIVS